jgi:glycosyltransferase involved in cell wall biosynthesis
MDRGHDVQVYAGWIGERSPLETWSETDEFGLPVRWIVTSPWIYWHLDLNWDNPSVTADFRQHLLDIAPDVVHFHSMQSLGAGLLPAAADAGVRVVVTMHDFWWCCGRQFLVDRDYQPCPLVVEAGNCPCEVDRPWLERRAALLREMLGHADLILAPSSIAAKVLAANGVDPRRLRVDENGLPDAGAAPTHQATRSEAVGGSKRLRFLYAGGPDRMKGVDVLFAAARLLGSRPDWQLHAYGAEPYVRDAGLRLDDLPVTVLPAFDPLGADGVFARSNVLVVPSVMRESHSLLTREALSRGLPVVCTDSLGPEEVVNHGRNGLVVPAADPSALKGALRRLLDEPELVPQLRSGCETVSIRSLDDQVRDLERTLVDLVDAPDETLAADPGGPPIGRVLFVCGIEGAPLRYRARLPAEALAMLGITSDVRHYRDPDLGELAAKADAVVMYRVPATMQVLGLIEDVRRRRAPVFFDVDDLIFDPDMAAEIPALQILPPDEAALWLEGVRRYRTTMEACDAYIGSTPALCRHASAITGLPVERFDNGVGTVLARHSDAALHVPRSSGPLRMGYLSGTNTHDHDWFSIEPAVIEILDRHSDVELWLGGFLPPSPALDRFSSRVVRLPFLPWLEVPTVLRDLDVNLAPLAPDSRFNEAKSAIKWIEAALTATPTVASPTEPFREAITHGVNGLLAGSPQEWVGCVEQLLGADDERARIGNRAQRDALLGWSPFLQGTRYRDLLERGRARALSGAGHGPGSGWTPLAHDEPPLAARYPLEEERAVLAPTSSEVVLTGTGDRHLASRALHLVVRAWVSWRKDGAVTTAGRAVDYVKRQFNDRVRPRTEQVVREMWGWLRP